MIFFGVKSKIVEGALVEGIQCPHCEQEEFITFGIMKYFHLYWIPTFPTSRVAGMECTHCKKTLMHKELPTDLSQEIKSMVFTKGNTIPMFSGLLLIGGLVAAVLLSSQ